MAQIQVADILGDIKQICREAPMPTLIGAYVRAARRFCNISRWLRADIPGACVIGAELYSLGSDTFNEIIGIRSIELTALDGKVNPLTSSSSGSWDADDENAEPELYQYVPEGQFAVHPKPDAAYSLTVQVVLQPKRGSNSIDDTLVVNWEYALQAGCLGYLLALPRQPYTDAAEAQRKMAEFSVACHSAQINADAGYNPGAAQTDRPGPRSGAVRSRILPI